MNDGKILNILKNKYNWFENSQLPSPEQIRLIRNVAKIVRGEIFTNAELNDLESYIGIIEGDDIYWGNKYRFVKRKESIKTKLKNIRESLL